MSISYASKNKIKSYGTLRCKLTDNLKIATLFFQNCTMGGKEPNMGGKRMNGTEREDEEKVFKEKQPNRKGERIFRISSSSPGPLHMLSFLLPRELKPLGLTPGLTPGVFYHYSYSAFDVSSARTSSRKAFGIHSAEMFCPPIDRILTGL